MEIPLELTASSSNADDAQLHRASTELDDSVASPATIPEEVTNPGIGRLLHSFLAICFLFYILLILHFFLCLLIFQRIQQSRHHHHESSPLLLHRRKRFLPIQMRLLMSISSSLRTINWIFQAILLDGSLQMIHSTILLDILLLQQWPMILVRMFLLYVMSVTPYNISIQ